MSTPRLSSLHLELVLSTVRRPDQQQHPHAHAQLHLARRHSTAIRLLHHQAGQQARRNRHPVRDARHVRLQDLDDQPQHAVTAQSDGAFTAAIF